MTEETQNDSNLILMTLAKLNAMNFYDKALIGIIIIFAIIQIYLFSQLVHIASPVYGGDLYRERGFIQYILNGNKYWTDPYFQGELEFYPPLGYLLGAFIVKITGLSVDSVINFFPIAITAALTISFYALGNAIFKRKDLAFILALIAMMQNLFPVKHTYGLSVIFAVLFLAQFFKLETDSSNKTKIKTGIFLGAAALSHYQPFLYTSVMTGITILLETAYRIKTQKTPIKTIKETVNKYFLTFFVAILIAMIFFAPLIVKYQMKTPNRTQEYSQFDTNKNGFGWLASTIANQFIQTTSIPQFLLGIIAIGGVLFCVLNTNKIEQRYTLFLLIGMIISGGHYLITKPLLNAWIVPSHMLAGLFIPIAIIITWGTKFFSAITEKKIHCKGKYFTLVFILLVILPISNSYVTNYNNDRWTQYGRQMDPSTQALYDFGNWALSATTKDEVFLANDESAFAISALSARHVVAVRRTHASPYADVDKRYADAIVMLYGNNFATTKELLRKYFVKYIFFDQYLLTQPMITSTKHADYLKQNGVNFSVQNVRLDPAGVDTPVYESIVVMPQELKIVNITTPIKQFNAGTTPFAIIYKTQ